MLLGLNWAYLWIKIFNKDLKKWINRCLGVRILFQVKILTKWLRFFYKGWFEFILFYLFSYIMKSNNILLEQFCHISPRVFISGFLMYFIHRISWVNGDWKTKIFTKIKTESIDDRKGALKTQNIKGLCNFCYFPDSFNSYICHHKSIILVKGDSIFRFSN